MAAKSFPSFKIATLTSVLFRLINDDCGVKFPSEISKSFVMQQITQAFIYTLYKSLKYCKISKKYSKSISTSCSEVKYLTFRLTVIFILNTQWKQSTQLARNLPICQISFFFKIHAGIFQAHRVSQTQVSLVSCRVNDRVDRTVNTGAVCVKRSENSRYNATICRNLSGVPRN